MTPFRSVFRALVLRPLLREKIRSLITIAGIAVGVAVLVAIELSNQSALRAFSESVDAVAGKANFQIVSESVAIDEKLLLALAPIWNAGGRFAPVIDIDGTIGAETTPIRILAVDLLSDLHFRDYRYARIVTGSKSDAGGSALAEFLPLFDDSAVIVSKSFAEQHGLQLRSPLLVQANGKSVRLTVRGILEAQGPGTAFNGSLIVLDIAAAQASFGMKGQLSRVDLMLPESTSESLVQSITRSLPSGSRIERPSRRNDRVEKMLRAFRINLLALAGVALLVGMFLVYNTVLISILRRRTDVGVLKTLGVSSRQILTAFVAEGALFGVIGSVAGLGLGYLLAFGALDLIGKTINALYVATTPETLTLSPWLVLSAIVLGTGVSVASAIQPAFEASRTRPVELIRPGLQQGVDRGRRTKFLLIALAAFGAAALATRIPAIDNISVGGYSSVILTVIAFSLLTPVALVAVARILRPPFRMVFGVIGSLAAASIPASLRRTSVACAALSLAIGMMVAISVMVGSFRETVRVWVDQTVKSDLWLRPARGLGNAPMAVFPPEILGELQTLPFVAAVDGFRGRDLVLNDVIIAVGSGDFAVAAKHSNLPMITPADSATAFRDAAARNGVFISESLSVKFRKTVGDTLTLPTALGSTSFPIAGVYRDYSNDRGVVVMDRSLFILHFKDENVNTVAVFLKPDVEPEFARRELEKRFGGKYGAFAFTNRDIRTEVMRIFDQTFLITYALLAVAIVVAVLGIINTLSALILERKRELALLRVTGMSRGELRNMTLLESAIIGTASTITGVLTGMALSYVLIFVINMQSFGWTIELHPPYRLTAVSLLITFLATVLAGLIPARLSAKVQMT